MHRDCILAIDQGTTSSRGLVVAADGAIIGECRQEFAQHYPQAGWVEHDPLEIWERAREVIGAAMAKAEIFAYHPWVASIVAGVGAFPVRRGHGDGPREPRLRPRRA